MGLILLLLRALPAPAAEVVDRIAAVVGTEVITLSEVNHVKKILLEDPTGPVKEIPPDQRDRWAGEKALESLINQALLKREIDKRQIEVTTAELNQALLGVLRQNRITMTELRKELQAKGIPIAAYRQQLAGEVRQYKFIQEIAGSKVLVTDEEVRRTFESNPRHDKGSFAEAAPAIRSALESHKFQEELNLYLKSARARTFVEVK